MKISDDKKAATISINGAFSATQVETLIADLSVLRANILPPVPFEPPKPTDPSGESLNVSAQDDPYLQARLLHDGRIRLWIRNHGLGWLVFNLPVEQARGLRDYLNANLPETPSSPSLFDDELGGANAPH